MFLFTILFNLLMLPFTLLRVAFGLFGISTHILMLPLKFFARHTVLCLVLIAALILYLALKKDPHAVDNLKPQPGAQQAAPLPKGAVPLIQPITKKEDGDSVFATDTYTIMSDPERLQYSQNFYSIMNSTADGQATSWAYYNIQGSIRPLSTFTNQMGAVCRPFTEVLKVHNIEQTLSGTACSNGNGSWCKLKPNATPECGLGHKSGTFDGLESAIKGLF